MRAELNRAVFCSLLIRDGDGFCETSTVFVEDLPFVNGVMPWRGGVLVAAIFSENQFPESF